MPSSQPWCATRRETAARSTRACHSAGDAAVAASVVVLLWMFTAKLPVCRRDCGARYRLAPLDGNETGACIPARWRSELAPDENMIDRDRPTAIYQEIQHRHRPHQRVFQAGLVPKISADAPTLVIGYDEKDQDRAGDGPREQPERKHRTAYELGDGDRRRPEFSGTIAVAVELPRQLGQIVRLHPGRWEHPERVAQPMRDERQSRDDAQQRLGPGGERLIERAKLREDERRGVDHLACEQLSAVGCWFRLKPDLAEIDAGAETRFDGLLAPALRRYFDQIRA